MQHHAEGTQASKMRWRKQWLNPSVRPYVIQKGARNANTRSVNASKNVCEAHAGCNGELGLSTSDVSLQIDGTGSPESDVPAIVAGAVINDCAAVLISGRLSSLLGDGIAIPALSPSRDRDRGT